MAFPQADEVARRVRALLQDETVPYRYTDAQIIDGINEGQDRMVALRPDAFIGVAFLPTRVAALVDDLSVPWRFVHLIALFVYGLLSLREDEYANDGRSAALMGATARLATIYPGDED